LKDLPAFYIVPGHRYANDMAALERDYKGFTATPVAAGLVLMERIEPVP